MGSKGASHGTGSGNSSKDVGASVSSSCRKGMSPGAAKVEMGPSCLGSIVQRSPSLAPPAVPPCAHEAIHDAVEGHRARVILGTVDGHRAQVICQSFSKTSKGRKTEFARRLEQNSLSHSGIEQFQQHSGGL